MKMFGPLCLILATMTLAGCYGPYPPGYGRGWHRGYNGGHHGWYDDRGGWRGEYSNGGWNR